MSGTQGMKITNHIPRGLTKFNDIIVAKGKGCHVWDKNGKKYLDLTAGIGALSTGHCHPTVVARVQEQVATLQMGQQNCFLSHPQHEQLTERLLKLMPVPSVDGIQKFPQVVKPDSSKISEMKTGSPPSGASSEQSTTPGSLKFSQVGPYATISANATAANASRSYNTSSGHTSLTGAQAAMSSVLNINSSSSLLRDPRMYQNNGNVPLDTFFFTNCGSECTDNAIKIARMATGKSNVIAIKGGFHGRTLMASSLTSSKVSYRYGFQPLMSGCFFSGTNRQSFDDVLYSQTGPGETCAVILEPVQGEAGVKMVDVQFLRYLRKVCTANNILLIFDEVQAGVGRAGKMWSGEHSGVIPDIMTFAKGISSGYPMGGIACSSTLTDLMSGNSMGGTGGGNPICLAASNATLEVVEEEKLIENSNRMGCYLKQNIESLKSTLATEGYPVIEDVRQYGLFCAIDLNVELVNVLEVITSAAREHGLVVISCGKNSLRIIPPLVISQQEIDLFLEKIELTLRGFK